MAKKHPNQGSQIGSLQSNLDVGRGEVKENALKAIVTSELFKLRVEKAKKGKGSFSRKMKHKGKEPYSNAA
ncbi:ribosome alternative rescue factor ArfA [Vibrio atypicus]|jgi:alternative ribosome-rescue factor|uniref:ribosome alternative rescue factor ArfA n=1 Tax=Vibrio atypicus TaxID=558271 RepID=UPI0013578C08|nr:ribosome alternative rescue factor ArfA [Vibrio atypicus]